MKGSAPLYFKNKSAFRKWLDSNHDKCTEQWIGFYKKATKIPSITWQESVDEALCYGWIDGLRKKVDDQRYMIRFTPRKQNSHWSSVNIERIKALKKEGLMKKPGLDAFSSRNPAKSSRASYEQKKVLLDPKYDKLLKSNAKASAYFDSKAPYYRKQCIWWIMSAVREETQIRRLNTLIECSEREDLIPPFRRNKKK